MWIIFSISCMVMLTATEIIGKKAVSTDELTPIKFRIMVMAVSVVLGFLMYCLGMGESGQTPWTLLMEHPALLAAACCTVLSEFLYMLSLRYASMTIMEAISSLEGIVIFVGLTAINVFSGRLDTINDMFDPVHLALIVVIMVFTYLLPNIESILKGKTTINANEYKERKRMVVGVLIALLAVVLGCGDSLIIDTISDSSELGVADMTMTAYFSQIFILPAFCFALAKKSKQTAASVRIVSRYTVTYTICYVIYFFLGLLAATADAVRSEIMYLAYPVLAILGAKVILKEKCTWQQNICIWVIILAAIIFCMIDYIV